MLVNYRGCIRHEDKQRSGSDAGDLFSGFVHWGCGIRSGSEGGGILHYMLPDSGLHEAKAGQNPFMFADTGIPRLFKTAYQLGARKQRMRVVVAGGAQILDQKGFLISAKEIMWP